MHSQDPMTLQFLPGLVCGVVRCGAVWCVWCGVCVWCGGGVCVVLCCVVWCVWSVCVCVVCGCGVVWCGAMRCGAWCVVVVWWCGGVVVWWCGGVVVWWCGGVVVWWCGGVVCVVVCGGVWWCVVVCGGVWGVVVCLCLCGGGVCGTEDSGHGVSGQARADVQLIGWQNTWEQAPGVPATPSRPDGRGDPGRVPVYTALKRPNDHHSTCR